MSNKIEVTMRTEGDKSSRTFLLNKYSKPRGRGSALRIEGDEVILAKWESDQIANKGVDSLNLAAQNIQSFQGSIGAASASLTLIASCLI